jgi:hypothetical protein
MYTHTQTVTKKIKLLTHHAGLEDSAGISAVQDGAHRRLPCQEVIAVVAADPGGLRYRLNNKCLVASLGLPYSPCLLDDGFAYDFIKRICTHNNRVIMDAKFGTSSYSS